MRIPVPQSICFQISQSAVRHAREDMRSWNWSDKSLQALQPMPGEGLVGIKTSLKYLMYQEKGTQPFLMWWVDGRVIPMACGQGDGPHFRRGGHVGEPGWVSIPHVGQVWRDQRWRHPGIRPKNFMQSGLEKAVEEAKPEIKKWVKSLFGGGQS